MQKNENLFIQKKLRKQTRHKYENLNAKNFTKTLKVNQIKFIPIPAHRIITPKNWVKTMTNSQANKWLKSAKNKIATQLKKNVFRTTKPPLRQKNIKNQ